MEDTRKQHKPQTNIEGSNTKTLTKQNKTKTKQTHNINTQNNKQQQKTIHTAHTPAQ